MTDKKVLNKIISIASKYSGLRANELSPSSSVNHDLQIDGDDIENMISEINSEIKLNFEGFDYSKYFNSESEIGLISSVFNFVFRRSKPSQKIEYDFKLGDFVRWKKEGVWKEEKQH